MVRRRAGSRIGEVPLHAVIATLLVLCASAAQCADPPRDPWRDPDWALAVHELAPESVRTIHFSETLYTDVRGEPRAFSTRDAMLEFDERARLVRLEQTIMRDFGAERRQRFSYRYDSAGRLERIDDADAGAPAFEQRFDARGRLVEIAERQGVLLIRTSIAYDAAGREVERTTDDGKGSTARREQRRYRSDGTPLRLEQTTPGIAGFSRTIDFDTKGRPQRVVVHDTFDRSTTQVEYPDPLTATYRKRGLAATRDRIGNYEHEVTYRVRDAAEFLRADPPEEPAVRIERRDNRTNETRTRFDTQGNPVQRRFYDERGQLKCVEDLVPHEASRSPPPAEPPCVGAVDVQRQIERDSRGHWSRQVLEVTLPQGRRRLLSEQSRSVEYR